MGEYGQLGGVTRTSEPTRVRSEPQAGRLNSQRGRPRHIHAGLGVLRLDVPGRAIQSAGRDDVDPVAKGGDGASYPPETTR